MQRNANVVQLVEHQLPKLRVAGSNPVIRSWDLIHFKGDAAERPHFLFHYTDFSNPFTVLKSVAPCTATDNTDAGEVILQLLGVF